MPKLLVFQHVPFEILGTLDPLLRSYGFRVRYVNFGRQPDARPRVSSYHGLVVLGGPMNVDQLKQLSDDTFGEWVKLFGDVRRRAPHPHR